MQEKAKKVDCKNLIRVANINYQSFAFYFVVVLISSLEFKLLGETIALSKILP